MSYDNVKAMKPVHFSMAQNAARYTRDPKNDRVKQPFAVTIAWGDDEAHTIPQTSRESMRETVLYLREKLGPICQVIGWRGNQPIDIIA